MIKVASYLELPGKEKLRYKCTDNALLVCKSKGSREGVRQKMWTAMTICYIKGSLVAYYL